MEREERSIAFDRAIEYYDRTRGLTPAAMRGIVETLQTELRGHRVLEIGVGTGRIGVPLMDAGIDLTGLDLSMPMLGKLKDKRRDAPVLQGDATRMPWRDGTFGRVLAVHVLHLVPSWRILLDEARRVLGPRGAFVVNDTEDFGDIWTKITQRFREAAGMGTAYVGVTDMAEISHHLGGGIRVRKLARTLETRSHTPLELIERLEQGLYSFTWELDEATRFAAGRATRGWAEAEYGSLTATVPSRYEIGWRVFEFV
jgi:SAM-dependent methyltransferase